MASMGFTRLGGGSFGEVFAKNMNTAVKISKTDNNIDLQSASREIHTFRIVKSSHSVPFKDAQYYDRGINILMKRADMNLYVLPKRGLSADTIYNYTVQLTCALRDLHEMSFVHRDIKPENILVKGEKLWLCDFGSSRQFSDEYVNQTGYIVTRQYRAPELLKLKTDTAKYTKKMDIWSLGAVIYELIYQRQMSPGNDGKECLSFIETVSVPENERMNERVKAVVCGCLKTDPNERFDMNEIHDALDISYECVELKLAPVQPDAETYNSVTWNSRKEYFELLNDEYPELHSVLAHAILLFDYGQKIENLELRFYCAVIFSSFIFGDSSFELLKSMKELMENGYDTDVRVTIASYICKSEVCENSAWHSNEYTWDDFLVKALNNPLKRKKS